VQKTLRRNARKHDRPTTHEGVWAGHSNPKRNNLPTNSQTGLNGLLHL